MKMTNQTIRTQQQLIVRRMLALIGFILLTGTPALAQQTVQGTEDTATGWRRIVSYSSGFEALMPKAATVSEEMLEEEGMKMLLRTFQSETDWGVYMVGTIDMSELFNGLKAEGMDTPKSRELLFSLMMEFAEPKIFGELPAALKVEKMGDTVFNGATGRLYQMKLFGGTVGEMRMLLHKDKVVMIMAADFSDDRIANSRRFHSSVRFF